MSPERGSPEKIFTDELFVFDLDGTLVHNLSRGRRGVPTFLLETILELSSKAHVAIATGRRVRSAQVVIDLLPDVNHYVFNNGLVVRHRDKGLIHKQTLSLQTAVRLAEALLAQDYQPIYVLDGERDEKDFASVRSSPSFWSNWIEQRQPEHLLRLESVQKVPEEFSGHILEVATLGYYKDLVQLREKLKSALPSGVKVVIVKNCGYGPLSVLEFYCEKTSKWTGVERLRDQLGLNKVVCFGDDENDLEMLQGADIGVVMDHAVEHVLRAGDIQVSAPEGLNEYLREHWVR